MPHKNTNKSSLLAIKKYVKSLNSSLTHQSDIELIDIINSEKPYSEAAKTLIIYRYLPKILKESRKIFSYQIINSWEQDEIIQTGTKAILYAIKDFSNKKEGEKTSALFTYIVTFYITKYLNRKKINYDPLIQFSKGAEFKKVFYSYFKAVKVLIKRNNRKNNRVCDKELCKELQTDIDTLKEVQYAHQQLSTIKSQEDKPTNTKSNLSSDYEDCLNYIDYATSKEWISPVIQKPLDPVKVIIENEPRKILCYKNALSDVEFKFLELLNSGKQKKQILNHLKISKQRFSFLAKNITKKIKVFNEGVYKQ